MRDAVLVFIFPGLTSRRRLTIALVGALVAWGACSSPAAYTRGPLPGAALPDPVVTVTKDRRTVTASSLTEPVELRGTLQRVQEGHRPAAGFRLEVRLDDGPPAIVDARTFVDAIPDMEPGRNVVIGVAPGPVLRISDEDGPVALVYSGASPPADPADPIRVRGTFDRAWTEVSSTEDLCRWTYVHGAVEVEAGDRRLELRPGAVQVVEAAGRRWLVAAGDWRVPEESDCGAAGEPRLRFTWIRVGKVNAREMP